MPRHPLASKIFSHEDQIFSHNEKIRHGPMWHFYLQAWYKKSDWKSDHAGNSRVTMLGSEPPTRCRNSNHGGKKDIVLKHLPPKIGTTTCFPYPAMQVSNSWHTQDGFFLHEKEGYSQVMFSSLLKSNVVKCTILR